MAVTINRDQSSDAFDQDGCNVIHVAVAGEHELARLGIRSILSAEADIEVVGEATSASEAIDLLRETRPDVLILDMQLERGSGIDVCKATYALDLGTRILVLGATKISSRSLSSLGICVYLPRSLTAKDLRKAIRKIAAEQSVLPLTAGSPLGHYEPSVVHSSKCGQVLTPREAEILRHLSQGLKNQEIAASLDISRKTVEAHVRQILLKFGVSNRTQAVVYAMRDGWVGT